jgi:Kef-type K+ transport system membrane component KefB
MSRFPDFMHMDLTKVTCGGCFLILLSLALAFGTAIGGGALLLWLFPGLSSQGSPDRWLMVPLVVAGFAVAGGAFQLGRHLLKRLGMRIYRDGSEE